MLKKIKTEIDRKKKSYLVWVGTRFKFGCERGRDWFARFGLCRFGVPVWCVSCDSWPCGREMWLTGYWLGCLFWRRRWYGRARERYGWRIEDGLTWFCDSVSESVDCEVRLWGLRERLQGVAGEERI